MKITLIAAVDESNGIGKDNAIAWQNDEDMRHFRQYTEGKVVVMGRKTWDSLPVKPLPRRYNWVITKSKIDDTILDLFIYNSGFMFSSFDYLMESTGYNSGLKGQEICIIGGQSIYEQFMPHATHLVITRIKGNYDCDRFFPVIDDTWHRYDIDVKDTCRIEYYKRKSA